MTPRSSFPPVLPLRFHIPSPLRPSRYLLQPLLDRITRTISAELPELFNRLGPHQYSRFLIDVRELPFLLLLHPDPESPRLSVCPRGWEPVCVAHISGNYRDLLSLIDGSNDGDALFFSRDLDITGNLEAVVCLRNALDDVEGSVAERVATSFGLPGKLTWAALRRHRNRFQSASASQ